MTRKDYELLAGAFKSAASDVIGSDFSFDEKLLQLEGITNAYEFVAAALTIDNARFDADRFVAACQPVEVVEV
jgi:hypothetical protein